MHIPTHILSGWCVANLFPINANERLLCMIAATIADVDGIGFFFGEKVYWDYHHTVGHNLFFGLIASSIIAMFATRRLLVAGLSLASFHLHLLMDYFGSGPGWPIHYLWPSHAMILRNHAAWEFSSWQNMAVFAGLSVWTVLIAKTRKRTPLELLLSRFDDALFKKSQTANPLP